MPQSEVFLFRDSQGNTPLLSWLDSQTMKVRIKCLEAIEQGIEWGSRH